MKYASVILIAISFLVTGWSLVTMTRHVTAPPAAQAQAAKDTEVEKMAGEAKGIQTTTAALQGLGALLAPSRPATGLIAYDPASVRGKGNGGDAGHHLTMLYYGKGYRRAVIDGRMVAPGDRLPEGTRVVAVRSNEVVLRDQTGRQTIPMPMDKIRIGTVARPAESK